jgi:aminoglycoside/choline kinase family phosphotransferase
MPPQIAWPSAERQAHFERWLASVAAPHGLDLLPRWVWLRPTPASGATCACRAVGSLIVMDAPPPLEDVRPFVHVAGLIATPPACTRRVCCKPTPTHGFLLLTDLGRRSTCRPASRHAGAGRSR